MLKQKSSEYRGYRTAGIRLKEEMLPQLGKLYAGRTKAMLPAVHAFDKAHTVMLVEEGMLPRKTGAAILKSIRGMEKKGVVETRAQVGGGLHSGEQYLIRLLGEDIGGRFHVARSSGDLSSVAINTLQRERLLGVLARGQPPAPRADRPRPQHTDTILPGYSFGQHAQPMTLAHLWLSWAATLARDFERLHGAYERVNVSPAGAAIMVGSELPGEPQAHRGAARLRCRPRELRRRDPRAQRRRQPRGRRRWSRCSITRSRNGPTTSIQWSTMRIQLRRHPGPLLQHVVDHDAEEERDRAGRGEGRVGGGAGLLRRVLSRAQGHDRPADHRALLRARDAVEGRRQRGARPRLVLRSAAGAQDQQGAHARAAPGATGRRRPTSPARW